MLPIYNESYRPSSNWVQDLALKREALQKLDPLEPALLAKVQEHLLVEQVTENLALGDISITPDRVRMLLSGGAQEGNDRTDRIALSFASAASYLHMLF